jgi:methionine-rich copper-binding protein CopC
MAMRCKNLIIVSLFLLGIVPLAKAHAILLTAKPAVGQVVRGPRVEVALRFNSRIDAQRSRITLVDPTVKPHPLPIRLQSSPDSLTSEAEGLRAGEYILQWQVLAADGHITRGEVRFRVREGD